MKKRKVEKYLINNMNTERYKKSAVPYMNILNEEEVKLKKALKNLSVPREHCYVNSISVKI